MSFKENLLTKIRIGILAGQVIQSIKPAEIGPKLNRVAMQELLKLAGYSLTKVRDLDLYLKENQENKILVLDNELALYNTSIDDVALRKSPTVKEMISIRNAIKILNDKDVVISKKNKTIETVCDEARAALDLSFSKADLDGIASDGLNSLGNGYGKGVQEALALFGELLNFKEAPEKWRLNNFHIIGKLYKKSSAEILFGPLVIYDQIHNELKLMKDAQEIHDKEGEALISRIALGKCDADLTGVGVWQFLKQMIMENR